MRLRRRVDAPMPPADTPTPPTRVVEYRVVLCVLVEAGDGEALAVRAGAWDGFGPNAVVREKERLEERFTDGNLWLDAFNGTTDLKC